MFCSVCGANVPEGSSGCANCRSPVYRQEELLLYTTCGDSL